MSETTENTFTPIVSVPVVDDQFKVRKQKGCLKDVICFVVLLIFIIIFVLAFAFGFYAGNPKQFLAPTDESGNMCGITKNQTANIDLTRTPKLFYSSVSPIESRCVTHCPEQGNWCLLPDGQFSQISQVGCIALNVSGYFLTSTPVYWVEVDKDMSSFLGQCVTSYSNVENDIPDFNKYKDILAISVNDISSSWLVILASVGVAFIIAYLAYLVFQCEVNCSIWSLLIISLILILAGAATSIFAGVLIGDSKLYFDVITAYTFYILGGFLALAFVFGLVMLICLGKRIKRNSGLFREGRRLLNGHCSAMLCSVVLFIIWAVVAVVFVVIWMHFIGMVRDPIDPTKPMDKLGFNYFRIVPLAALVIFLWFSITLISTNESITSAVIGTAYFDRDTTQLKQKQDFTFCHIICNFGCGALGSTALGSILNLIAKPFGCCCVWSALCLRRQEKIKNLEDRLWEERKAEQRGDNAVQPISDEQPMNSQSAVVESEYDQEHASQPTSAAPVQVIIRDEAIEEVKPGQACDCCIPCCQRCCYGCSGCFGSLTMLAHVTGAYTQLGYCSSAKKSSQILRRPWNQQRVDALMFPSAISFIFAMIEIAIATLCTIAALVLFIRPDILGLNKYVAVLNWDVDVFQGWILVIFIFFLTFYTAKLTLNSFETAIKSVFMCFAFEEEEIRKDRTGEETDYQLYASGAISDYFSEIDSNYVLKWEMKMKEAEVSYPQRIDKLTEQKKMDLLKKQLKKESDEKMKAQKAQLKAEESAIKARLANEEANALTNNESRAHLVNDQDPSGGVVTEDID
ncbi:Choline-transporter-like protein [Blattamonas nauphoetae]|uniref:Choline transporter-like protein n=1 Tax=Blattamonas nauphoetae TaxID=2049346 RepID=A0ABQ9XUW3_9EUKA|nr:Choline-transporter-like protein [Blattamonas nauphoetae]